MTVDVKMIPDDITRSIDTRRYNTRYRRHTPIPDDTQMAQKHRIATLTTGTLGSILLQYWGDVGSGEWGDEYSGGEIFWSVLFLLIVFFFHL